MASTSGKVSSNGYQGRYITFSWSLTNQSVKNNTSTIAWRLEGDGTAQSSRYKAGNFKVVIDGVTVYSTPQDARIWLYDGTLVTSGNYTFTHNDAGQKSFSVQIQAGIYTEVVNCTGSGSFTLPTISRVSTITDINGVNTTDELSVNYNEYVSSYKNNLIITLGANDLETITDYQSGAAFELSDEALAIIYENVTTAKTATLLFHLDTYDGATLLGSSDIINKTLNISDSMPTIGTITYKDINATTTAITTDNQYIVRNKSTLAISIDSITAANDATIERIEITGGGVSKTIYVGEETYTLIDESLGAVNQSSDFALTVKVTDSRGFSVSKNITVLVYDYAAPTAIVTAARQANYYSNTDVTASVNYSDLGGHNTLTIIASYAIEGQSSYTDVMLQNNVTRTLNLDNTKRWSLRVQVTDRLSNTVTYRQIIEIGLPIFFIDTAYRAIGVNCLPQAANSLEVNGLRLDDKIYIGSQQIYDYYTNAAAGDDVLACAYDYKLIEGIFAGVTIPNNYEKAYKVTFQYTTANSNLVVSLNNLSSDNCSTSSSDTYREIGFIDMFKESDIILENVNGTTLTGINLSVSNSAAYTVKIWAITVHGYFINKDTQL